jgi:hypothetical protein
MATTTTTFSRATCRVLLLIATLTVLTQVASARPRLCAFGHAHHASKIQECVFGWEVDSCGHKVCTKGPGEQCGGKHAVYGICGEGLVCSNCNRCTGCSLRNFECFEDRQCLV